MLRKLVSQTAVYGVSTIVARLLNYLLTPYLTRIMPPAEYGVVTDMYALIPFALVVLTMGMETGYFHFTGNESTEQGKRRIFATTWGATLCLAVLFVFVVLLFTAPIAAAMEYADHTSYVLCVVGIIAFDVATAIPFARLRERGKAGSYVMFRLLSIVVNFALTIFFFGFLPTLAHQSSVLASIYDPGFGVGYLFVANLISSALIFFTILVTTDGIWPRIDARRLGTILLYSLPLLLSGIAGTANEYIDRQMIKYLMPSDVAMVELGIYGAVVKIAVVMTLFTQMYRLAAEPFFLSRFSRDEFTRVNAQALKYYAIVSLTIFITIALFSDLFALIVGRDFRQGMEILPLILMTNVLNGIMFNLSFWYKQSGNTRYALLITGSGLVVTIVMLVVMVPLWGIVGAAVASLFCSVVTVAVSYYLNQRFMPTPYDLRSIGLYFALALALFGVGSVAGQTTLGAVTKYGINGLLVAIFVIFALRKERIDIGSIVKSILRR